MGNWILLEDVWVNLALAKHIEIKPIDIVSKQYCVTIHFSDSIHHYETNESTKLNLEYYLSLH